MIDFIGLAILGVFVILIGANMLIYDYYKEKPITGIGLSLVLSVGIIIFAVMFGTVMSW